MELQKMKTVDAKISEETQTLKDKMKKMKDELFQFESVDNIKQDFDNNKQVSLLLMLNHINLKQKVLNEKQSYLKRKELLMQQNQYLTEQNETKDKTLRDNEMHSQLEVLEKSLRHYEQNNFSMREYIQAKGKESDYKSMSVEVNNLVTELNTLLLTS